MSWEARVGVLPPTHTDRPHSGAINPCFYDYTVAGKCFMHTLPLESMHMVSSWSILGGRRCRSSQACYCRPFGTPTSNVSWGMACVYTHMYVLYVHIYTQMFIFFIYVYMYTCIHACIYFMYTDIHVDVRAASIHAYIYIYVFTCIPTTYRQFDRCTYM
jgi:hypothetical protein